MKDNIFTELYNKLLGFFRQAEEEESAKDVACSRLRVVLMQDRTNLTPELMERMRKELVELLSKYLEMDKEALELNLEQDGDQVALMLSIPVIRAKDEEEIADCERAKDAHGDDESAEQSVDTLNESNQAKAALEAEEAQEDTSEEEDVNDEDEDLDDEGVPDDDEENEENKKN